MGAPSCAFDLAADRHSSSNVGGSWWGADIETVSEKRTETEDLFERVGEFDGRVSKKA
jgi:hypothetical protein